MTLPTLKKVYQLDLMQLKHFAQSVGNHCLDEFAYDNEISNDTGFRLSLNTDNLYRDSQKQVANFILDHYKELTKYDVVMLWVSW